jgi:phosphoglycerol transferase MdoB-like AlkP superfamily enzyme
VHDLPFLNWIGDMHSSFPQPFMSVWFSISNHFPFEIPADCPEAIRSRPISNNDKTIRYADHALGAYFKKVRNEPWFANTVFLITGDHCFYAADAPGRAMMTNFQVPLLILGPGVSPGRESRLGCHLNVPPTLIELLRLDTYHANAGVSLFSQTNDPIALNNLMGVVTLATDTISYSTNFEQRQPCFAGKNGAWTRAEWLETGEQAKALEHKMKALYQVCNNVRIENKLVAKDWMK